MNRTPTAVRVASRPWASAPQLFGFAALLFNAALALVGTPLAAQPLSPVRESGQTVSPAYEGWYKNPDGTISMSFGYFNRNAKEVVEMPIGPNNFFSPGPADRGQPTSFQPRRHWGVFAVTVPADWPERDKVTWTLVVRGDTLRVPGHLRPNWQIDALEGEAGSGNTPPVLKFAVDGKSGAGPGGVASATVLTGKVGAAIELKVWATDDGKGRSSIAGVGRAAAIPVTLRWFKHTGPGEVTFINPAPPASGPGGLASTTARFSAPGDYSLRVRANDASGIAGAGHAQCCWSNGFVRVTVLP